MDRESKGRGLDRSGVGAGSPARRSPRNKTIGIIGKSTLTDAEKEALYFIGRALARLGHRLALIPAKGTADKVREGFEFEGGELVILENDVIGHADHTHVFPDHRLLTRLRNSYPNIEAREDVLVIREDQLQEYRDAVQTVLEDKDIDIPA